MKKFFLVYLAAAASMALVPAAALANVTGSITGEGNTRPQAQYNAQLGINQACSPYGGVQSSTLVNFAYHDGIWYAYYRYTCNQ